MQNDKRISQLFQLVFIASYICLSPKFASCFIIKDSCRHAQLHTLSAAKSPTGPSFENDLLETVQSQPQGQTHLNPVDLEPSKSAQRHRSLNYYQRKEILYKILHEKNEALIKDLISKAAPEDLVPRRRRTQKEKRVVEKDEDLISALAQPDESDVIEDTGFAEPTAINHVRAGNIVIHKNTIYIVTSIQHIAQARAKGHYKAKMQLLHTTKETSFSFPDASKLVVINPKKVACTYTHVDEVSNSYVFRTENTEIQVPKTTNVASLKYLKPGLKVAITRWKNTILNVFVPFHIEYRVVKLNTGNYAATLDNGLVVLVPTYIKVNDHIEITTKAGEFLRRTKTA